MYRPTEYVYTLTCLKNGKRYVGSTVKPQIRKKQHFNNLKAHRHCNKRLQQDFDKYGIENFVFEIICENRFHLSIQGSEEKKYIGLLKTYDERYGYNERDILSYSFRKKAGLPQLWKFRLKGWKTKQMTCMEG